MDEKQRKLKIVEEFMNDYQMEGLCGYWVNWSTDDEEDDRIIEVYLILDEDWIKSAQTKPGFVANRMRNGVKEEIKKWLGFDVYVGSTSKKCNEIKENKKKTITMNESKLKKLLKETITEDSFVLNRKIFVLNQIIENFDSIDCSGRLVEGYERVYCEKLGSPSKEKVLKLKEIYKKKLDDKIRMDLKRLKSKGLNESYDRDSLYPKETIVRMLMKGPKEIRVHIKTLPDIPCENDNGERTICTKIPEVVHVYLTGRY